MTTGILTAACMCLVLGQNPGDPMHFNYRNHRVPVEVPIALRPQIKELLLYGSGDQGRTWNHVAGPITPEKDHFAFFAPGDGIYWLRVVQINKNGVQEPDDQGLRNGPPSMKLAIDTAKPIVRSFQTQRLDDEVYVNWDVQEDNLDSKGMRLEYQIKGGPDVWKSAPLQATLKGQTRFNPGTKQPLTVRLTVTDLAKNESFSVQEAAGIVLPVAFNTAGVGGQTATEPIVPKEIPLPTGLDKPLMNFPPIDTTKPVPMPAPMPIENPFDKKPLDGLKPLPMPGPTPIESPLDRKPIGAIVPTPIENPLDRKPIGAIVPQTVQKPAPTEKVVADSSLPPPVVQKVNAAPLIAPPSGGIRPTSNETVLETRPITSPVVARKLAPLQYVNQHQVMLEYELKRVGPSGVGSIEVWLTKDDGETWDAYRKDEDVQSTAANLRQKRNIDLRDPLDRPLPDGIYGMALVVKSRAGLGRTPRPGDAPEIRVEIDTQRPEAKLFLPVPDPQQPDQLLLKWSARDKNLADRPIHLEFATKLDGDWQPIRLDLENGGRYTNETVSGDFSWKVPPGTPLQVYLRMRVRDKAGNELVLVTPQPQFVDLTEPEGALIGVQPNGKAP